MNTGDYTNQLQALMDFFDKSGLGGPRGSSSMGDSFGGGGFTSAMNNANYNGDRMRFAQSILGQLNGPHGFSQGLSPAPNFFNFGPQQQLQAGSVGSFTPPRPMTPLNAPDLGAANPQYPQYGANEAIPANVIARSQGFPMTPPNALAALMRK